MAKIRILITAFIGAFSYFLYCVSDKYRQGFNYCDICYRKALNNIKESMEYEKHHTSVCVETDKKYDKPYSDAYAEGLREGYKRCLLKLDILLRHIGEYHEG